MDYMYSKTYILLVLKETFSILSLCSHFRLVSSSNPSVLNMALTMLEDKIILLIVMLVTTFIFGLLPVGIIGVGGTGLARSPRGKNIITLLSCYAGGVFLAACLMDLFPDVRESIDHVLDEIEKSYNVSIDYPVAEFIIMFGFFLILFIENAFQMLKEREVRRANEV